MKLRVCKYPKPEGWLSFVPLVIHLHKGQFSIGTAWIFIGFSVYLKWGEPK